MAYSSSVPSEFSSLFWDIDLARLDISEHKQFIIERVLNMGDEHGLKWLWHVYSQDAIRDVVQTSRKLTRKTARCWQNYFGLREDQMRCFSTYSRIAETSSGTFHGWVDNIQVTWLRYPNRILDDFVSVDDIAIMKWAAISDRGSRKDFIDLFAICRNGISNRRLGSSAPEEIPKCKY